jgi:hypothetical protein
MKKIAIILSLFSFVIGIAQENKVKTDVKNELKLNALLFVIQPVELTYERILTDDAGIGASIYFIKKGEADVNFSFTPFYRAYFGKKKAAGFFVEGFAMYNSGNNGGYREYDYVNNVYYDVKGVDFSDLAVGFSLGAKWIHRKNFIFEINGGIGRNLLNQNSPEVVGRGGISLGYRF